METVTGEGLCGNAMDGGGMVDDAWLDGSSCVHKYSKSSEQFTTHLDPASEAGADIDAG